MTIRLLVTGAGGQLGRELLASPASADIEIVALGRPALDITQAPAVEAVLRAVRPAVVVNAAAYTAVDRAESESDAAFAVNRDGAGNLAAACAACGAALLQVSTDYVFDGRAARPYREPDPVAPLSVYGRSKAAGETSVRAAGGRALILRTGWLFGAEGRNFSKTMLGLGLERSELRVVADQMGGPTPAAELADRILTLARWLAEGRPLPPILHLGGAPETSWHGFAEAVFAAAARHGYAARPRLAPIGTAEYQSPAARPSYSALDSGAAAALGLAPIDWRAGLEAAMARILTAMRQERTR